MEALPLLCVSRVKLSAHAPILLIVILNSPVALGNGYFSLIGSLLCRPEYFSTFRPWLGLCNAAIIHPSPNVITDLNASDLHSLPVVTLTTGRCSPGKQAISAVAPWGGSSFFFFREAGSRISICVLVALSVYLPPYPPLPPSLPLPLSLPSPSASSYPLCPSMSLSLWPLSLCLAPSPFPSLPLPSPWLALSRFSPVLSVSLRGRQQTNWPPVLQSVLRAEL